MAMAPRPCTTTAAILLIFCAIGSDQVTQMAPPTIDPAATVLTKNKIGGGAKIEAPVYLGLNARIGFLSIIRAGTIIEDKVDILSEVETNGDVLIKKGCIIKTGVKLANAQLYEGVRVGTDTIITNSRIASGCKIGPYSEITDSVLNKNILVLSAVALKRTFAARYVHFYSDVVVPVDTVLRKSMIAIRSPETSRLLRMLMPFQKEFGEWKTKSETSNPNILTSNEFEYQINGALKKAAEECNKHPPKTDSALRKDIRKMLLHPVYNYLQHFYGPVKMNHLIAEKKDIEKSDFHHIHFGCDHVKPVSAKIRELMVKALAIIENSQLLPYERIDGHDFCDIMREILNGIRKVIAIDAHCAKDDQKDHICYDNCGKKTVKSSAKSMINLNTPSEYDDKKKTLLPEQNPLAGENSETKHNGNVLGSAASLKHLDKINEHGKLKPKPTQAEHIDSLHHEPTLTRPAIEHSQIISKPTEEGKTNGPEPTHNGKQVGSESASKHLEKIDEHGKLKVEPSDTGSVKDNGPTKSIPKDENLFALEALPFFSTRTVE